MFVFKERVLCKRPRTRWREYVSNWMGFSTGSKRTGPSDLRVSNDGASPFTIPPIPRHINMAHVRAMSLFYLVVNSVLNNPTHIDALKPQQQTAMNVSHVEVTWARLRLRHFENVTSASLWLVYVAVYLFGMAPPQKNGSIWDMADSEAGYGSND